MSKKISRTLLLSFFLVIIIVSLSVNMLFLSMFGCFWFGFIISAIISKEQNNLLVWAGMRGIPTPTIKKEDKHERTERESDGKTK